MRNIKKVDVLCGKSENTNLSMALQALLLIKVLH